MRKLLYIILAIIIGFGVTHQAFALTLAPAKFEISGDPGQTLGGNIEIFNEQDEEKTFYSSIENFEPRGDTGAPFFVGAKDGLATWVLTTNTIVISKGERLKIPFTITIPKDAEPGGYFAAVFFGSQPPDTKGGTVSIGGKVGTLVLLRVNGYIPERGGLVDFFSKEQTRFFNRLPIAFNFRFNNKGGDRVAPLGSVTIKNTFRMTTAVVSANANQGSVLPNSTRKFEVDWGTDSSDKTKQLGFFQTLGQQWSDIHFGWYTADINLTWGTTNQKAVASYSFFVIPWQLTLVFLLIFILIIMGIKRYNRWIIHSARK